MDPPAYLDKVSDAVNFLCLINWLLQRSYKLLIHSNDKAGRLTIIDPNRPDNNISGGSHEIERVFRSFKQAHGDLVSKLQDFGSETDTSSFSFLKDLVGGNFTAYELQRSVLRDLYRGNRRQAGKLV